MSDKAKSADKSVAVCLSNTHTHTHQRSEKSAILHLSNEYKWMMIVGHWEWRAGWPSLMWNRAAHANTRTWHSLHVRGWGGSFASHYSHSVITFWWDMSPGPFLSRSLTQMFYLIGSEGGLSCCCRRNRRPARLSHHSFVMRLVLAQFERNL